MKRSTYKKILDACRAAKKVERGGWGIVSGKLRKGSLWSEIVPLKIWEASGAMCAIGAFLVGKEIPHEQLENHGRKEMRAAAIELGLTTGQVNSFIRGFDWEASDGRTKPRGTYAEAGLRLAKTLEREGILACGS